MADNRIAGLNAITEINTALDFLPIVDVSDPQMANSGTTKKITINQILGAGTNVVVPAGTAGSPSISFSGDSNTGIYAPAADQLSISSGGSGNATVSSTGLSVTGSVSATSTITGTQLISTVAIGTAPLSITSTTVVSNLNADLLDGQHGSFYRDADNITAGTLAVTRGGTGVTTSTGTGSVVLSISPTLSGTPVSTTAVADTNTTQIATTAYVIGQASSTTPAALGSANVGTSLKYARADHVHPLPTIDLAAGVTGTLPVGSGGTGLSTYAVGDLIYASAATTLAKLASVASGSVLVSGGVATAPSWGKVELDLHVSKQLPVSNGGTGASTFTAGRVLFGNGTSALNTSSNLFWDNGNNRLGIATATPATKLHINGEVALPLSNLIYWNAYYGTGSFRSIAAGKSGYIATLADGSLQFSNTTDSAASADQSISFSERLRIASNGVCTWSNVVNAGTAMTLNGTGLGIGTATPSVALDVNGSAYFRASSAILGAGTPFEWISTYPNRTQAYQSSGNDFEINNISSGGFRLYLNSTERLRIASDGVCTWSNVGGVASTAMTLNGTGLGVGATPSAAIHSAKAAAANPTGGSAAGAGLYVSNVNPLYGMMFGVNGGGVGWIQQQRSDTNTQYDLSLQPLGGNVGIGTASPAVKFHLSGSDSILALLNGATKGIRVSFNAAESKIEGVDNTGTGSYQPLSIGGSEIRFDLSNSRKATLDSSGNLGLGVTPSAKLHVNADNASTISSILAKMGGGDQEFKLVARNGDGGAVGNVESVRFGLERVGVWNSGIRFFRGGAGTDGYLLFSTSGQDRLTIDSSGNVGIGTATPNRKLEVAAGTGGAALRLTNTNGNSGIEILTASDKTSWRIGAQYNVDQAFEITPSTAVGGTTFSTPAVVVTSSGNLGLGVTPSAWKANHKAIQFGPYSGSYGTLYVDDSGNSWFGELFYQGASNRIYTGTGNAAAYRLTATGQHQWYTDSVGGVAGGTVSLTQAMTLDASGNLALGTSTANFRADIQNSSGAAVLRLKGGTGAAQGSAVYMTYAGGANTLLGIGDRATILGGTPDQLACIYSGVPLTFEINGSERLRIDASGNLLVGTTSANGSLTVVGAQVVDGTTYYVASLAANNSPVAGRGSGLAFRTNVGSFTPVICAIEGVKENGTTDDYASALDFSTRVNGGFMTKRLRIDSTGNTILYQPLRAANGTASAPSISFDSDTNTGMYRFGADTLGFTTGGVPVFKVNSNGSFGYTTDIGGAVTQATSRTTGVTLNSPCGGITLVSAAGSTSWQTFTVTNSTVEATDVVRVCQKSGTDLYQIHVTNVSAGSFKVTFATTGGTTTEQPVFNFAVIKATTGNPV